MFSEMGNMLGGWLRQTREGLSELQVAGGTR